MLCWCFQYYWKINALNALLEELLYSAEGRYGASAISYAENQMMVGNSHVRPGKQKFRGTQLLCVGD